MKIRAGTMKAEIYQAIISRERTSLSELVWAVDLPLKKVREAVKQLINSNAVENIGTQQAPIYTIGRKDECVEAALRVWEVMRTWTGSGSANTQSSAANGR